MNHFVAAAAVAVTSLMPAAVDPTADAAGFVEVGRIINNALEAWKVIVKNQPVVDVKQQFANALPRGIDHWEELSGWQPPVSKTYTFCAVNRLGMEVARVEYRLVYIYGGSLNGTGHYLMGVTAEPTRISVRWGFDLDFSAYAVTVANFGSSDDPVAGMRFDLNWQLNSPLQKQEGTASFFIDGNGGFKELGGQKVAN